MEFVNILLQIEAKAVKNIRRHFFNLAVIVNWKMAAGTKRRSQVTGQGTGHRLQVTGHRAQVTGHRAQVTGHRAQGTGHRKRSKNS